MGRLTLNAAQRALDGDGAPVSAARLCVYVAGSDIQSPIFEDFHLTQIQANPLIADDEGYFAPIHLIDGSYRVVVETAQGRVLSDDDMVSVVTQLQSGTAAGGFSFATLTDLLTDTALTYTAAQPDTVVPGDLVQVQVPGLLYEVAPEAEVAAHATTATASPVKFFETGRVFSSLERLQAAVARGVSYDVQAVVIAGGQFYRFADDGNTDLPGLTGWVAATAQDEVRLSGIETDIAGLQTEVSGLSGLQIEVSAAETAAATAVTAAEGARDTALGYANSAATQAAGAAASETAAAASETVAATSASAAAASETAAAASASVAAASETAAAASASAAAASETAASLSEAAAAGSATAASTSEAAATGGATAAQSAQIAAEAARDTAQGDAAAAAASETTATSQAATAMAQAAAAAGSAATAATEADMAATAALAAGRPLFDTVAAGEAGTVAGAYFLVYTNPGLDLYHNVGGSGILQGPILTPPTAYADVAALQAAPGTHPAGTILTTQREGYAYQVADPGATDHDVTVGALKLYVQPTGGAVWDAQWFDIADDATRVQAAIDWAITRTAMGMAYKVMVVGVYTMHKPITLARLHSSGTSWDFVSVTVEAPAAAYLNNKKTVWKFTDLNAPGVVIHRGRKVTFRNISIVGSANNLLLPSYQDLLERNSWWNVNGARDEQFSPHVGVSFDHFDSALAPGSRYPYYDGSTPGVPDHYTNRSGGTTQTLFEDCEIQGWVVGRLDAGSDIQLGDSIVFRDCNLSYNGVAWVPSESQNRGNALIECHGKGFDVLVSTGRYGAGSGALNRVQGGVYVYGHSLVEGNVDTGDGSFEGVYVESTWALGHIDGRHGFTFSRCQIKLVDGLELGLPEVDLHLTGTGRVNFNGGYIGKNRNLPFRLRMEGYCNIDGTVLDELPFFTDYTTQNIQHVPLRASGGIASTQYLGNINSVLSNPKPGVGARIIFGDTIWSSASEWSFIYGGGGTVTITGNGTATVSGMDTDTVMVGDEIGVLTGWTGLNNENEPTTFRNVGIGRVTDVSGGVVTLGGVPISFTDGTYQFYTFRIPLMRLHSFGDLAAGSSVIANVGPTVSWQVGDWIRAEGLPVYARVTAVNGTELTVSKPATQTRQGAELYDALVTLTYKLAKNPPGTGSYPAGSFVTNVAPTIDANNMVLQGWICTEGGTPGVWHPVYQSVTSPAA